MERNVATRGRVVVLHFVGQMPLAGIAWQAAQYLVRLERLHKAGVKKLSRTDPDSRLLRERGGSPWDTRPPWR